MKEVGDMKVFVLLIVVLAAFIYGYFLMGKLDKFFEENQSQKLISGSKLRIGFENKFRYAVVKGQYHACSWGDETYSKMFSYLIFERSW